VGKISVRSGWDAYTRLMSGDPSRSREDAMLHNMRLHHRYECLADPRIFATMVPEPEYHFYGSRGNAILHGMDEVQAFYYSAWASRSSLVELDVDYVAFADWGAAAAGCMRQQVPAADGGWSLVETHLSWFFPYREIGGQILLGGEVCHIDAAGATRTPIAPADVLSMDEAAAQFADTMHLV
jgi:hypothetical protein